MTSSRCRAEGISYHTSRRNKGISSHILVRPLLEYRLVLLRPRLDGTWEGLRVARQVRSTLRRPTASSQAKEAVNTYHKNPRLYSPSGVISIPFSSTAFSISKRVRMFAMVNHIESMAMNLPGQIRLPNPNAATAGSRTSGSNVPSGRKKRSGLKSDVSGPYAFSSCRMALQPSFRLANECLNEISQCQDLVQQSAVDKYAKRTNCWRRRGCPWEDSTPYTRRPRLTYAARLRTVAMVSTPGIYRDFQRDARTERNDGVPAQTFSKDRFYIRQRRLVRKAW